MGQVINEIISQIKSQYIYIYNDIDPDSQEPRGWNGMVWWYFSFLGESEKNSEVWQGYWPVMFLGGIKLTCRDLVYNASLSLWRWMWHWRGSRPENYKY